MTKLQIKAEPSLLKILYMGYSGEGKSTSLVPLSIPGYRDGPGFELRWLDFDGKAEEVVRSVLTRLLTEKKISQEQHDIALTQNNDICSCIEPTGIISAIENKKSIKKIGVAGQAVAWNTAVKQIGAWEHSFSDKHILIVDSFTYAVRAIVNYSQQLNSKLNQNLEWRDFMGPQQMAETLMVLCADLPTNVIVCAHQDPLELYKATSEIDKDGKPVEDLIDTLMVPVSVGKAGRMKLPARFNHLLLVTSEGKAEATRRWIYTQSRIGVVTKTPFYGRCETRYPIDSGMVDYFKLRI